jgi:hypothetical protein
MAPIKSKRKDVVESFLQGNMAEPMRHENVLPFIKTNTNGLIHVVQAFQVGLVNSREDNISAGPPDAVCVMECTTVGLVDGNGMCWIWFRTWMMMMFNTWRLNAIHSSSKAIASEQCNTRRKLLAARTYYGRFFDDII